MLIEPGEASGESTGDTYDDRKIDGRCTRHGCMLLATDDSLLCNGHALAARKARKRHNKKQRAAKRAKGMCDDCTSRAVTGWYCLRCNTRRNILRRTTVTSGESTGDKYARRSARMIVDDTGRMRYRGQVRRGQQPRYQLDVKDIEDAVSALLRVKEGLAAINASDLRGSQVKEAVAEILAIGALGCRLFGDVLLRHGCDPEMLVTERDDEE